jgi:hypothetical protein
VAFRQAPERFIDRDRERSVAMDKRLKPEDVGYFGKGIPTGETLNQLQARYAEQVRATLSPEMAAKVARFQELASRPNDEASRKAALALAIELAPILNFKMDDVDWDT